MSTPATATTPLPGAEPPNPPDRGMGRGRAALALLAVAVLAGVVAGLTVGLNRGGSSPVATPTPAVAPGSVTPSGPTVKAGSAAGSVPVPAGFPSAATTGVPVGMSLRTMTGALTISSPGTVLSDVLVDGCLTVDADNVTIRNSKIMCDKAVPVVSTSNAVSGTVLDHVELDGTGVAIVGMQAKNVVATAINVHNTGDGVHLGQDSTLQDSYVHDLANQPNLHHDCLQTLKQSTAAHVLVQHNTLEAYQVGRNDNTVYHGGSGSISDVRFLGNYMDGGHYSIEIANTAGQSGIVFSGNHFGRHYDFGIIQSPKSGKAVSFVGNVFQDTGGPATEALAVGHGLKS